ncbi:MAG: hypothetical protein AB7V50_07080 [Vampirovibrionia bacterium]
MVLYDDKTELNIEKFDLYTQYRDQICYLKVNDKTLNVIITPESWQELSEIVNNKNPQSLNEWLCNIMPDNYGQNKEFLFEHNLLNILLEKLKEKFN